MEITVSLGLVALGFALFALAVRYLPVFPEPAAGARGERVHTRIGLQIVAAVGAGHGARVSRCWRP